ncbi:MAG: Fis family transcriptional regulator [Bdellovibrionales bacterium RIFOXYD1_FULL_44_7]|nr:MAG: Fis family transcriptional regulator [Bdellovibrionales bacterium RIFOXYD1_FULL_44_7]
MSRSVLVVDDEASIRQSLEGALRDEGFRVSSAASGKECLEFLKKDRCDVVLLDIWMPDMDGLETLKHIKAGLADQTVIMMSGHGTIDTAVRSTKLGAFDFVEKPLNLERLLVLLHNACSVHDLARENQALRKQVEKSKVLVGDSAPMKQIKELIKRVAPTTGSVLIVGENGTGKELVANSIHALSSRYNKPFVEVNCAAIPEELIESELFGHEKGSFTGATQLRRGKFDLAHGGTLFLDEIGDMSLKTQAKILRILQEQKFERVGGTQTIAVDVRVVAATNKDLKAEIQRNQFREDLYYRLNVIPFHVPPLRERKEDIPLLTGHFMKEFTSLHGKAEREITPEAMQVLLSYPWPGNVRELRNFIERMVILTSDSEDGKKILAASILSHLKDDAFTLRNEGAVSEVQDEQANTPKNLRDARQEFEKDFIIKTLKENDWNISKTAAVLGIERSYLHRKIKSYGIEA